MFRETYRSATEELAMREARRMQEFRNSAAGQMMEEAMRRANDPLHQLILQHATHSRTHELDHWFYYRTHILNSNNVHEEAVNKLLERLGLLKKFDPESFANRIRAALKKQAICSGIVKAHSPPVLIIPSSLHPIESVA